MLPCARMALEEIPPSPFNPAVSQALPDRLACVHVPALPLQLLMRRHPHWQGRPIAVVDEDRPQGLVLWVNERCHRARILPGMRFAAALALDADLCAGVVPAQEVDTAIADLLTTLRRFSPAIEPSAEQPGVCWLDASGLTALFPDLPTWASELAAALQANDWRECAVVVGFERFSTYALAQTRRGVSVLHSRDEEYAAADRVPLARLRLPTDLRDTLARLGIRDLAGLRRLPAHALAVRFSAEAADLQRAAAGTLPTPLVAAAWQPPIEQRFDFEPGSHDIDSARLLAQIEAELPALCAQVAARGQAVDSLHLHVWMAKGRSATTSVRTATPTLEREQLLELLRLRLPTLLLGAEVEGFTLRLEPAGAAAAQLQLFAQGGCDGQRHRDHAAGNRALARLRAELGDDAVVTAKLVPGHLPEAQFRWEPCSTLQPANPRPALSQEQGSHEQGPHGPGLQEQGQPRLVRRLLAQPMPLAHQQAGEDGWFIGRLNFGPVQNLHGPYVLAGGWWRRAVHREYYFAQTRRGDVVWIFHDRVRRRWCAHGGVE